MMMMRCVYLEYIRRVKYGIKIGIWCQDMHDTLVQQNADDSMLLKQSSTTNLKQSALANGALFLFAFGDAFLISIRSSVHSFIHSFVKLDG
jgi:hypothetical protein